MEAFHDFLDNIFWSGYAQQLAEDDAQRYLYEWSQFVQNYGG